jgi:hypothetical protein
VLSITPAQAAALKAISEGQREAAKRQAEEQRPSGGEQSPAAAAADAQRDARKAEAEARHEAVRREAEARQQEQQKRIEEQQAAAQRDREAQRAAIEQSQKARPERPAAAEGAARPTAEEWERYQADLQKWRDERAAQMAEQRRRLQERLDAAIDRMPSPPMVRPQEPSLDWSPPTPPFRGEYSAPAFRQADPPRYWYPAYSYGPPSGAYPGAAPGTFGYGSGGLPSR